MELRRADANDVDRLAPLFDAYRRFYEQPSDLSGAREFLAQRLTHGQAVVFLALDHDAALGFTLLYPMFSSVAIGPMLLLNDLFVTPAARGRRVGRALLERARAYARETGVPRIELATAISNRGAQALYESLGYVRDTEFYYYALKV